MKKILSIAAIAVLGIFGAQAQDGGFEKGDFYATGSLGFTTTSQGQASSDTYTFSPGAGYFVSENIALEAQVTFGSATTEVAGTSTDISTAGVGVGAVYFFTPSNKFSFTTGLGVAYLRSKYGEGDNAPKNNTFGVNLTPGVHYFVSDHVALRASIAALSYTSSKFDFDGAEAVNTFGFNLNLTDVNFGIVYKF
ncbi:porin family protein [Tenacibaculum xiamenense]|uniref:porin family protein n=1 Tax=Tenacibaculum xiamenense TaxID=1261553 RepID=UPI003893443D